MFLFYSETGFMCMELRAESDRVLTLKVGRLSRDRDEACNKNLFFDAASSLRTTLISEHFSPFSSFCVFYKNIFQVQNIFTPNAL